MKTKKPTVSDIARLAKVSQSTVSMILNNRSDVSFSEETIRRVKAASEQLGYFKAPCRNAASILFTKKTIIVFCPSVTSPYYAALVQSIEQAANAKGYSVLVYNTYRDPKRERKALDALRSTNLAGVIFTISPQLKDLAEEINKTIPIVVISDRTQDVNIDAIELNNYNAGVLVAQHLLELGHQHIAYISTTLDEYNTARTRRLDGLTSTFCSESPHRTVLVKSRNITHEMDLNRLQIEHTVGFELTQECLSDKRITAFVAVNDMVAYGVIDALVSLNFSIPEDYSVCGFDNLFPSGFARVSLTSVEHHIVDKGHNAFEMLLNKIEHNNSGTTPNIITRVEYQNKLIVRRSTGPAPVRPGQ